MSRLRLTSALLALTVGAAACTATDGDPSTSPTTNLDGDRILLTSALETVDGCDTLLDRLKTEGMERVGPYGFGNGLYGPIAFGLEGDDAGAETAAMEEGTADGASFSPAAAPVQDEAGTDFSGTNNQEEGVDEADLVKTDGRRLVTVSGDKLRVIDVEASEPRLIKTVKLPEEFYGGELFLSGDTALLMTSGWTSVPFMSGRSIPTDC